MKGGVRAPWGILFMAAACLVIVMLIQSCAQEKDRRNHLGYFTNVDGISISSGGGQLTFTGCGHADFAGCTVYRYDRKENVLYRYVHEDRSIEMAKSRYWSDSDRFLLSIAPTSQDGKQLLDDVQIAIVNPDGTGLKRLTEGKGIKAGYMLSPDGKTLVYARGRERTEGKTPASHFDYYARDVATGKETQITDLAFYETGVPCFTPDGRNIVFNNGSPLKVPGKDDGRADEELRQAYERKDHGNRSVQYPVDGSGIKRLPEPWLVHGAGSRNPMITRDGSLWFEGTTGGIKYYRRYSNGEITQFTNEELVIGRARYPFRISVDPTGNWLAILYEEIENGKGRSVGIFDVSHRKTTSVAVPATAINIAIH